MKPGQILATGLLFFLMFMPFFALVGDIRILCEIEDDSGCDQYALMQGILGAGLLLGLMLSVGGAYKMRKFASANKATFGGGVWFAHEGNLDDSTEETNAVQNDRLFVQEYGINDNTYGNVVNALNQEKVKAESTIQHLLAQLEMHSGSDPEIQTMRQDQEKLESRVANIEYAKVQMAKEMKMLQMQTEETKVQMQDSVISGDVIINSPESIAKAMIDALNTRGEDKQQ